MVLDRVYAMHGAAGVLRVLSSRYRLVGLVRFVLRRRVLISNGEKIDFWGN